VSVSTKVVSVAVGLALAGASELALAKLAPRYRVPVLGAGLRDMGTITTSDGTEIYFKDWGAGQPIVFSHGWPLSADDWDAQMLFFAQHGYRVIATTGAVTADPARPATATTWTTTPTTWRR